MRELLQASGENSTLVANTLGDVVATAAHVPMYVVPPAHNILFMNFPRQRSGHFYIELLPRLTAIAGFELATGMFIDIIDPAAAARRLR